MIQNIDINRLSEWKRNPRKISRLNLEKLKRSILEDQDFLNVRPLLVNKVGEDYLVYAGNQRLKASKELGLKEIPCAVEENMDEELMKKRAIKDNVSHGEFVMDEVAELNLSDEFLEEMNLELKDKNEKITPEVEFTEELLEEHNYVVLYFENEIDWLQLMSVYPLKTKAALDSKPGYTKSGIGRVVKGSDFLNAILNK